jgi:hypothetical protein
LGELVVLLAVASVADLALLFWFEGIEVLVGVSDGSGVLGGVEDFVFEWELRVGHAG